jgi:hypothetical protein
LLLFYSFERTNDIVFTVEFLLFYLFECTNDIVFTVEFLLFYLFERTKDIVFTVEFLLLYLFERIYDWFCWCPICSGVFTVEIEQQNKTNVNTPQQIEQQTFNSKYTLTNKITKNQQ